MKKILSTPHPDCARILSVEERKKLLFSHLQRQDPQYKSDSRPSELRLAGPIYKKRDPQKYPRDFLLVKEDPLPSTVSDTSTVLVKKDPTISTDSLKPPHSPASFLEHSLTERLLDLKKRLHEFIQNDAHIKFVQREWKNDVFLKALMNAEALLTELQYTSSDEIQDGQNAIHLKNLHEIKRSLMFISLDPRFSFETLGIPDKIGIGPYTAPSDEMSLKKSNTLLKEWVLTSCDSDIFAVIHLRQKIGTLESGSYLQEGYHHFFVKHTLAFLTSLISLTDKNTSLNVILTRLTDPKNSSRYREFKDSLSSFLNEYFEKCEKNELNLMASKMYELEPFKFKTTLLLVLHQTSFYKPLFSKIWNEILDKSFRLYQGLQGNSDYTKDQETLNEMFYLTDTFLKEKDLPLEDSFKNSTNPIEENSILVNLDSKFSQDCRNYLDRHVKALHSEWYSTYRHFFKVKISDIVESKDLAPSSSKTLFLKQFQSSSLSFPNQLGNSLSTVSLFALIPFFVKGFIDALSESKDIATQSYLIKTLSHFKSISLRNHRTEDYEKLSLYEKESIEILREMSKTELPVLELSDPELIKQYQDIREHLEKLR